MADEDLETPARSPWLSRFGCTVGVATLASLLASAPAALRFAGAGDIAIARAWLTTTGLLVAPMLILVPLARLARESLRGFAGNETGALERASAATFFVCTWLWFAQTAGALLRAKTHQRALGGVTFAIAVVASFVVLAFVARRLARILTALRSRNRNAGTAAAALVALLAVVLFGLRISHTAPALEDATRAALVDGVAIALAVAFFARKTFDDRRIVSRIGPPIAVLALVVSMHTLATLPMAITSFEHVCPVHFAILQGFAHLSL